MRSTALKRGKSRRRALRGPAPDPFDVIDQEVVRGCWFASLPDAGECEGPVYVRAHLIPQELIYRTVGEGWGKYADDPRSWRPCCAGRSGLAGHHGHFDGYRLKVPRHMLPPEVEDLAAELGLLAWLDRRYGALECAA